MPRKRTSSFADVVCDDSHEMLCQSKQRELRVDRWTLERERRGTRHAARWLPAYRWLSPADLLDPPIELDRDLFNDAQDVELL
jgi:hypothetical protein